MSFVLKKVEVKRIKKNGFLPLRRTKSAHKIQKMLQFIFWRSNDLVREGTCTLKDN